MRYNTAMPRRPELNDAMSPLSNRVLASVLFVCCGGPLVLAATLTPDPAGMGTHTQLGLLDCGFEFATGYPCATCGCTTAFAYAADGSLLQALLTQPFGAFLALGLAMMTLVAGWSACTNMPLAPIGRMLGNKRFILFGAVLLLAAWAYKAAIVATAG